MNIKSEIRKVNSGSVRIDQNNHDDNSINDSNHNDNNSDDYGDDVVAQQTHLSTERQFPIICQSW